MLDLCCGLKGASAAMKERGWKVITLDIDPDFHPDIVADVREWSWDGDRPDLIWASPPCNEFSREYFVWSRTNTPPDLSIYNACKRIICQADPKWWIIENVRGAVPFFGRPTAIYYPYYLWGRFPYLGKIDLSNRRHKESLPSCAKAERAQIPYALSRAVAVAIESSIPLPLEVA
jgi:hypothetical protein